ncbi:methyltransferase domain-containing protein [Streptomyces sp. LRE541]|uniref:methyltransferase domain-containing protein n=1 Tax=Streptomyces sp. LRE541 TaxID=2931983 RepID=UPI00200BF06A|nr:methyltransferase domain-containing protein [Streptomyces sp. LRE541]UPZ26405.1 methyltransferase domain-containing protein [Streptomyces sp. LRE541]
MPQANLAGATDSGHAAYFAFRDTLLGAARTKVLGGAELCEVGRLIYGSPQGLSLYGVAAPDMEARGLRLLGRTTIECSVDAYVAPVADAVAELHAALAPAEDAMVVDLFCGSGNFGYHLGTRLGRRVYACELDPAVYEATRNNLDRLGLDIELHLLDYRDLLGKLPPCSPHDTYIVEPPWGPAFTADGLDLTRTSPPVPEILQDILRSRDGEPCLVAIKTNDQIANDSLATAFSSAVHLRTITPKATLPYGANMDFHLYRLGSPQAAEQSVESAVAVAGLFDTIGLRYEEAYQHLPEQLASLEWLLARLPASARVLDIGSGTGRPTAELLANAGHRVTGIDVSATMADLAAQQVPSAHFALADVRTFEDLATGWDAICAYFPLLSMPRPELDATLAAITEGLAPGGYFIFATVPCDWDDDTMVWMGHQVKATSYPADVYVEKLRGCGLEIAHHAVTTFQPRFPGMDAETHLFVYARKPLGI